MLVHGGGSVVVPLAFMRRVDPFEFVNPYADDYFTDAAPVAIR